MIYLLSILFSLTMMRADSILVTGVAGFIGSHIAEQLLQSGHVVVGIDNFFTISHGYADRYQLLRRSTLDYLKTTYERFFFYECDITDRLNLDTIIQMYKFDKICHLAGLGNVRYSMENPQEYIDNNVKGTVHLLELMRLYAIPHIVMASSSSVYGLHDKSLFSETDVINTMQSIYAVSKYTTELIAQVYHKLYGINITALRFFTVYGPRARMDMAPFLFMDAIVHERPITIMGDGSACRDFTYIDDVVQGFCKALDKPFGFEVINIGSGFVITVNEFINVIESIVGKKAILQYQKPHLADVPFTHADITKAKAIIKYQPEHTWYDGLRQMYAWYQQLPDPLYKNKIEYVCDVYE